MKKLQTHSAGIGAIAIVLVLVVIGVIGAVGYKVATNNNQSDKKDSGAQYAGISRDGQKSSQSSSADLSAQPKLFNLGVEKLGPYDAASGTSGGFLVTKQAINVDTSRNFTFKGFYSFGEPLDEKRHNPNFEFAAVGKDTPIISAIDGVVVHIEEQAESKDYEVFLQTVENSEWMIGYDHITNLKVSQGQTIKVGDVIGTAAQQNNGFYRYEIQINREANGETTFHCPTNLLDDSVAASIKKDITDLMTNWESVAGLDLYDTTAMAAPGCKSLIMNVAEAEGR